MDYSLLLSAIIYANFLTLLSIGFTLVYLTAKIPNFAHGSFATVGVYVCFTVAYILNTNPYFSIPLAFIVTGGLALLIYKIVLGSLRRHGASILSQMIAIIAVELIISAFINIYADYIQFVKHVYSRTVLLRYLDFRYAGLPGVFIISTITVITLITCLHLILTKTKFGISMRATVEDSSLASILGVNVELVTSVSWFLTGGLAGIAGSFMPLWFQSDTKSGYRILTSIFASSILGGLSSIYGAIIGGYIIGLTEILVTNSLAQVFGPSVIPFRMMVPLSIMSIILLVFPRGITGVIESLRTYGLKSITKRWRR